MQRHLFLALFIVFGVATFGHAADNKIKVHVFSAADPSGFTDQNGKDRAAAVQDAASALSRSKVVEVVPKPEDADVTLEITRRVDELAKTSMAKSMWKNNSWARSADSMQPFLYGTLTAGEFTTELRSPEPESKGKGSQLAKAFEDWVRDNRTQILAQRNSR